MVSLHLERNHIPLRGFPRLFDESFPDAWLRYLLDLDFALKKSPLLRDERAQVVEVDAGDTLCLAAHADGVDDGEKRVTVL